MTIEADDKGDTRISQGNQYAVLTRDGVTWLLQSDLSGTFAVRQEDWIAVNFSRMHDALGKMGHDAEPPHDMTGPLFDLVQGGRETVGGRTGTAWSLRPKEGPGAHAATAAFSFVVSEDADLAPIGRALANQFDASLGGMRTMLGSTPDMMKKMADIYAKGTVISMSRILRLESVDTAPIPPSEFALPATILTREQYEVRVNPKAPPPRP